MAALNIPGSKKTLQEEPQARAPNIPGAAVSVDTSKLQQVRGQASTPLGGADNIPSNWNITPDGDKVQAVNNITGNVFKGTHKEFSAMLRGE
jgi:hypothetical protein